MRESLKSKGKGTCTEKTKRVTLVLKPGNFERLKKEAQLNKRTMPQQILFLLEGIMTPEEAKSQDVPSV